MLRYILCSNHYAKRMKMRAFAIMSALQVPVLVSELHELCSELAKNFIKPRFIPRVDTGVCGVLSDAAIVKLVEAVASSK